MPTTIRLLSQRIRVLEEENLHVPCGTPAADEAHEAGHGHPAYGVYDERTQIITLDAHLPFERRRETLVHENLHAMFAIGRLNDVLGQEAIGLDEHIVGVLSPILLCWLRENPRLVAYLAETRR